MVSKRMLFVVCPIPITVPVLADRMVGYRGELSRTFRLSHHKMKATGIEFPDFGGFLTLIRATVVRLRSNTKLLTSLQNSTAELPSDAQCRKNRRNCGKNLKKYLIFINCFT